jgi:hypothetical protein
MTIQVNQAVVAGPPAFPIDNYYIPTLPKAAAVACLSEADSAPWTNRVPQHEPWPRGLMGNNSANSPNMESEFNTAHNPQFVDDGGTGSQSINRVEGTDTLERGQFWRR